MEDHTDRYHSLVIILHWVMALAFILMLASGLALEGLDLDKSTKFQLFQLHKSGGVLLLLAFFLRLGGRVLTKVPPLPGSLLPLEKKAAKIGHWALYVLMLLVPLSGWMIVSTSSSGIPTIVFNIFEWPHIPGVQGNKDLHEGAEEAHEIMAYLFMALIVGHIAAVVKHKIVEKENLISRMWWK